MLARKPDNVTFEQAASVPAAGLIVLQNLRGLAQWPPGRKVLVNGAGGGVGTLALQMMKAQGAHVTAVDSRAKLAMLQSLGADEVVDYAREDATVITRNYVVRANSRFSVFVDDIPGLTDTSVATTVTSTNGVPIVVERAMYWPNGFFNYIEGHTSVGTTQTARRWAVANGEGNPDTFTYVLLANTENRAGQENFQRMRAEGQGHQIEREGKELRSMMSWIDTEFGEG